MARVISVGIVPRGTYDFRGLRGGSVSMPLVQRVDVANADTLALELWVHDGQVPNGARLVLHAASDGSADGSDAAPLLQTRTAAGESIANFVVDSETVLPTFQLIPIPTEHIGRRLALMLEVSGGPTDGPKLTLAIDLLVRETAASEPLVEPIITAPDAEDSASSACMGRIATAAREALAAVRPRPRRYPRWREIVV